MKKKVLCLLIAGFEEIEAIAPIDLLRRAGVEVVVATVTGEKLVTGRCNVAVQMDVALDDAAQQDFDLLFIPGGPGVKALRTDGRAAALARDFAKSGKLIGAICAAPTVLNDAGLLTGKRYTSHSSVVNELPQSLPKRAGGRGRQHHYVARSGVRPSNSGLALVKRLCGEAVANRSFKEYHGLSFSKDQTVKMFTFGVPPSGGKLSSWNLGRLKAELRTIAALCLISVAMASEPPKPIDPGNMVTSVKPGTDFYLYANGKWLASVPIPADESSWGSFMEVRERSIRIQHDLLEEAAKQTDAPKGSPTQLAGDLYASAMDAARAPKRTALIRSTMK